MAESNGGVGHHIPGDGTPEGRQREGEGGSALDPKGQTESNLNLEQIALKRIADSTTVTRCHLPLRRSS